MLRFVTQYAVAASLALVAGCSSGQSNSEPPFTTANLNQDKAQLAVGIATFPDHSKGLNAMTTFRQPDGLSATLVNTPTITGPPGFIVPNAASAGVDAGTNHISGSPQVASNPEASTFGETGGAFNFGFAPINSDTTGSLYNSVYNTVFYSGAFLAPSSIPNPIDFRGGPPAYPNVLDGTYPSGFEGFTQGFTTFAVKPVAGTYTLSIFIGAANTSSTTITATPGKLTNLAGLGGIASAPTFAEDGSGGGTATCTVPAAATETLVDLSDVSATQFYTVVVNHGGLVKAVFAPNLGAYSSGVPGPTIASGDEYSVSCIAVNYPVFESGPPNNSQQLPTITGANGQADVSFSPNYDNSNGYARASRSSRRPHPVEAGPPK